MKPPPPAIGYRLSDRVLQLLRCPICKSRLTDAGCQFTCNAQICSASFPVVNRIPILINEASSLFSISDYMGSMTPSPDRWTPAKRLFDLLPDISRNVRADRNYGRFIRLLAAQQGKPLVLIIGGRVLGSGVEVLLSESSIELIHSDVSPGPITEIVCDAHSLPFEDASLDGVVIQAVLEYVVDPYRCVDEIHRVLKDDGLVYSETPFMQQVHDRLDFTRFTHLGHRRLFRRFEELSSGAVCGPGMALAWSYEYLLLSFARSRAARAAVKVFARATAFWLKYLDYYLVDNESALDAASGCYFMGRKSNQVLADRELVKLYRGAQ